MCAPLMRARRSAFLYQPIRRHYALDDIREAFIYVASGRKIGNVLLTFPDQEDRIRDEVFKLPITAIQTVVERLAYERDLWRSFAMSSCPEARTIFHIRADQGWKPVCPAEDRGSIWALRTTGHFDKEDAQAHDFRDSTPPRRTQRVFPEGTNLLLAHHCNDHFDATASALPSPLNVFR